jgi:hypothetical protein
MMEKLLELLFWYLVFGVPSILLTSITGSSFFATSASSA